jgi:hypothetical protein
LTIWPRLAVTLFASRNFLDFSHMAGLGTAITAVRFDTLAVGCAALTVPADHLDKEFFELAGSKGVTDVVELNCRYSAPPHFVRSKEPGVSGGDKMYQNGGEIVY